MSNDYLTTMRSEKDGGSHLAAIALLAVLLLAVSVFIPATRGGFLFDDYPNLEPLGHYGGVVDLSSFYSFVAGGFSGPTGRPISLVSFLLNDNTWPSQPYSFKYTNLAIHLLCGVLLCWASLLVLRVYGYSERSAQWIAVFAAACWILHPYFISTTFYIVQRMAQLAALFSLAGIVAYLIGRELIPTRPRVAYAIMAGSIAAFTLLAVFSKENGILLPLLIGVIELCAPRHVARPRPNWRFLTIFILLPGLVVFGYLGSRIDLSGERISTRHFSQVERTLTQPRILLDYLGNLLAPRIESQGLYRDDIVLSRNLTTPPTTAPALLAIIALACAAILLRRRMPLFSLALLFFFVGHLLESTIIPLELYFEHRNYLPALFLFLPLGGGLHALAGAIGPRLPILLACVILGVLAFLSAQRARLWSDTEHLQRFWAVSAPNSPRAVSALATWYAQEGRSMDAQRLIIDAVQRLPDNALLTIRLLLQQVANGTATEADFDQAADKLARQPFDPQTIMGLRKVAELVSADGASPEYRRGTLSLLDTLAKTSHYADLSMYRRLHQYLQGQLLLAQDKPDEAHEALLRAMDLYGDTDSALAMVAMMGSADHFDLALDMLERAEALFEAQPDNTLKRPRRTYEHEIAILRGKLQDLRADHTPASESGADGAD